MNPHDLATTPEACASANSATPAFLMFQSLSRDCLIIIQHIQSNVNTNFQKNLKNLKNIFLYLLGFRHRFVLSPFWSF